MIWAVTDAVVTGDPLYSLHSTSSLAEELGRASGVGAVPHATWAFLSALDKPYVLAAALAGLALVTVLIPRRLGLPALLLAIGLATFGLVGVAGLSIINRYLLVPSLMVMIFAAVAAGGWTLLEPGRIRRAWSVLFAVAVAAAGVYMGINANLVHFESELAFRGHYRTDLTRLLADPAVKAGLRCGPLSTPNHKLIPDVRWISGLDERQVIARSDRRKRHRIRRGVALYVTDRYALVRQAFVSPLDDPATQLPLPGFRRVATYGYYGAYVRCPGQPS